MLGKLIKHEWKAVGKVLAIMNVALILMAIIGKIMLSMEMLQKAEPMESIFTAWLGGYIISVVAVGVGTHIYLAVRFYKNMYTDEGYLSFTLPVKPWEHIFAKTLVSSIWILINGVAIVGSIIILVTYKGMGTELLHGCNLLIEIVAKNGIYGVWKVVQVIITIVLSSVSIALTYYFSISMGQLFNSHKMLASVVIYFVTNNVLRIVSTMFGMGIMFVTLAQIETETISFYNNMLGFEMSEGIVVTVGFWLIVNFIMNKKLNLE